jgi:AcrR family transcriptional regulator
MAARTRARNDREKEARAGVIVASARELFARGSFASVTVEEISSRAGISKGTVFLYFATKEALALAVLELLLDEWTRDLEQRLTRLGMRGSPETVATAARKSLESREELLALLPLMGAVLEANAPVEARGRFRGSLRDAANRLGRLLEDSIGFVGPGEGVDVAMTIVAMAMGIQQMSGARTAGSDGPSVDLPPQFRVDVPPAVGRTLRLHLEGMRAVAERTPPPADLTSTHRHPQ